MFDFRWRHTKRRRQFLLDLLPDGSNLVQPALSALLEVLGDYQVYEALPFVRAHLSHADATVRFFACDALGWIGGLDDLPLLVELFEDHEGAALFDGDPVAGAAKTAHRRIQDLDDEE